MLGSFSSPSASLSLWDCIHLQSPPSPCSLHTSSSHHTLNKISSCHYVSPHVSLWSPYSHIKLALASRSLHLPLSSLTLRMAGCLRKASRGYQISPLQRSVPQPPCTTTHPTWPMPCALPREHWEHLTASVNALFLLTSCFPTRTAAPGRFSLSHSCCYYFSTDQMNTTTFFSTWETSLHLAQGSQPIRLPRGSRSRLTSFNFGG